MRFLSGRSTSHDVVVPRAWREVVSVVNRVCSVHTTLSPFVCILGYVEDVSSVDSIRGPYAIHGKKGDSSALAGC